MYGYAVIAVLLPPGRLRYARPSSLKSVVQPLRVPEKMVFHECRNEEEWP